MSPYPYLIFYRVTDDEVIVQRMRHSSRRVRHAVTVNGYARGSTGMTVVNTAPT